MLDKDTECVGHIFQGKVFQCKEVTDEESRRGTAFLDGLNGQLIVPYEAELKLPGKYKLARIELRPIIAEQFEKDGVHEGNDFITAAISAAHDVEQRPETPLMLARHTNPAWNVTIEPRPSSVVLSAEDIHIFPYAGSPDQLSALTSRYIGHQGPVPTAYVDQHKRLIDSALVRLADLKLKQYCDGEQTDITALVLESGLFPHPEAKIRTNTDGKRCLAIENDSGDELQIHAVRDQVYVRQVWQHKKGTKIAVEGLAAVWAGGKLVYAVHDTQTPVKDGWIERSFFYDEPYAQIYPHASSSFPIARVEETGRKANALLALKLP